MTAPSSSGWRSWSTSRRRPKSADPPLGAVDEGVATARDLVNEPANMLGPVEFAARAKELDERSASRSRC